MSDDTDQDRPLLPASLDARHRPSIGTVVDHWECPCCDRSIAVVHRAGRPRLYCSAACRQRAYRWRRRNGVYTTSRPAWPAESASVPFGKHQHALRTDRDPLARRRDRAGREVTACGALAQPKRRAENGTNRVPFLASTPSTCRSCEALTRPRPLGLVPPGATPELRPLERGDISSIRALHAISRDYPLDPRIRRLLETAWAI